VLEALHAPTAKDSVAVLLLEVAAATLVGIAVHLYVEKPLLRKIRQAFARKTSEQVVLETR
jgi:peptidoglycan/LPS O-acetylase OafA/YrhL